MKKQTVTALALFLLIPIVLKLDGWLLRLMNPEIAAGHPNYVLSYNVISFVKIMLFWAMVTVIAILWLCVCFLVIRSKERSPSWLFLAALGPLGFAILSMLDDKAPSETDRYARFVRNLNTFVRIAYEAVIFFLIWEVAYQAMVFKRNLMIQYESLTTGVSVAQIIDTQNASSGMWAFAEGNEVMYSMVLFYLLLPIAFNVVGRLAATTPALKAR